jgi:hypothetical protein
MKTSNGFFVALALLAALLAVACASGGNSSSGKTVVDDDDASPGDDTLPSACCDQFAYCYSATLAQCATFTNGIFESGHTCDDYLCGNKSGACCFAGGKCTERTVQTECLAQSGTWAGDKSCAAANCPS